MASVLQLLKALRGFSNRRLVELVFKPGRLDEVQRSCLDATTAGLDLDWRLRIGLREGPRLILRDL